MSDDTFERFTYVGNDRLSHIASQSVLSMTSSNARSQSNIYLDDPDYYYTHQNAHNLAPQYSASTMNMSSMGTDPSAHGMLKSATSMQQLKGPTMQMNTQQNLPIDHGRAQQQQSVQSIPEIYEQQLMNERLMCIQQMMASGQNFASMFNDDPHFAQQIMAYMASAQQQQQDDMMDQ